MTHRHHRPPERPLDETDFAEHLVDLVQNQNLYANDRSFVEAALELFDRHLEYRVDVLDAEPDLTEVVVTEGAQVRMYHAQGLHCGRMTCPRCNGRDVE